MKPKGSGLHSLEDYLALSNKEIASYNKRFTSVIRLYEGIEDWHEAEEKGRALRANGEIEDYLNSIRLEVPEAETKVPVSKTAFSTPPALNPPKTIYQKNYDRLMEVAPKLEEKLKNFQGEYIFGKAVKTGYLDFYLEVLSQEGNKFRVAISRHSKEGSNLVPSPDMEILVDIKKRTVESLHFKDATKDIKVYTIVDGRKFGDKKEKKSQNEFLEDLLKELRSHGQKVKWLGEGSQKNPSSFIVDDFKKEEPKETPLRIVPPTEAPEQEISKSKDGVEELEQARIIPLNAGYTEDERKGMIENFFRIVILNEKTGFKEQALKSLKIINDGKTVPYLLKAWNKMKESDYRHLILLNYFRLNSIVPNLLETLKQEGGTIRLVSDQTKTAFRITLGDDRKENVVILGIYQMNGKNPEPTLLLKIQTDSGAISTDLSMNQFAGQKDFNSDEPSRFSESLYESAIAFERWLKYLTLKQFKPILVTLRKVENKPIVEVQEPENTQEVVLEEPDEFDDNYINKDIPDFEPGHVELTETHKKYGVTQKVINKINRTLKGVVILTRAKAMVYNTKDKIADLAHQAQMPGFRLSRTGKFYFEGRSNRADRTQSGY